MNEIPTNIPAPQPEPIQPKPFITAEKVLFDTVLEYLLYFWKYFAVAAIVFLPYACFTAWFESANRPWYLMVIYGFIGTLISYYPQIALLYMTRELQSNNPAKIRHAYLTSVGIYLPFVWTMIMIMVLFYCGILLCVIPGILVLVIFGIADGIVVWEGINGIPALKRSH